MALALTNLTFGTAGTQTGTSASVAFTNSTLYVISLFAHATSANVALVTPVATNGLTWVQIAKTNGSAQDQVGIYCAYATSGVTTGTQAFDTGSANTSRLRWSIESVTGSQASGDGTNGFGTPGYEQRTTAQTSSAVTLAAFANATTNIAFGIVGTNANAAITAEGSYTTLSNGEGNGMSHLVEYILGQDLSVTSTFASATVVAAAVEIKAPAAGDSVGFIPI